MNCLNLSQFDGEELQRVEEEMGDKAGSSSREADRVGAAAQRIVDEANRNLPAANNLEAWKAKAEKAVSLSRCGITLTH